MRGENGQRQPRFDRLFLVVAFILTSWVIPARAADDLSPTLQRGLFEEEANNNLPAAIKAYEAVVNATDAQRKLAGTALFRLAECHRKLGRTNDAVALYQRVLREYSDQTRLADLSRQYVVTKAPAELGNDLGTERTRLLERELADQRTEYARLAALYGSLTNLTRSELKKVLPTAAPEPLLTALLEQRLKAEQRLAEFPEGISPSHPDLLSAKASLKTIDRQIEERLDGIVAGIAVKVATQKALLDQSTKALEEARAGAGAGTPALSQSARAEQKRLLEEEIKIVEKDLAEMEQQRKNGVLPDNASHPKQRELLALRRQVAALADLPLASRSAFEERLNTIVAAASTGGTNDSAFAQRLRAIVERSAAGEPSAVTPTDEEDKEVRRIQALIKDSPDLINAGDNGGSTPLHKAAGKGQLVVARFLLANKAAVNARRSGNMTPLHDAVDGGHKSMTELLLANGAEVNAAASDGNTPLHYAAVRGYKAIAELLLANKAIVNAVNAGGGTPLHGAVDKGFTSVAETLLASGASVNALKGGDFGNPGNNDWSLRGLYGAALHMAVFDGNQPMTELLLAHHAEVNVANPFGETPLHLAAAGNNSTLAGLLLAAKADVNARASKPGIDLGQTPLCYAVTKGRAEMVEFLLKNGADPNVRFGGNPNNADTPLTAAIAYNTINDRERIVSALLQHKADPNAKNGQGNAPLHLIAFYARPKALTEVLLTNGADVEIRDSSGNTPLYYKSGGKENVELLLAHKANPNSQNNEGDTPLHKLVQRTQGNNPSSEKELAELFIARGADVNLRNRQGLTPLNLYGVPARPGYTLGEELAEVLRKHGAKDEQLDLMADSDSIRVWRKGMTYGRVVFVRDEAGHNRFTLMEALLNFYSIRSEPATAAPRPAAQARTARTATPGQPGLLAPASGGVTVQAFGAAPQPLSGSPAVMTFGGGPVSTYDPLYEFSFPDLTRIRILRLVDPAKNEKKVISVNLINAAGIALCANDVLLEFGDIIEIPVREYRLDEGRSGMTGDQNKQFSDCVLRKVQVVVKGEATEVKLLPLNTMAYLSSAMNLSPVRTVLRSTSDLSRLRITRHADPATGQPAGELKVDLETFQRSGKRQWDDLWLRDGDVIEVPERE